MASFKNLEKIYNAGKNELMQTEQLDHWTKEDYLIIYCQALV